MGSNGISSHFSVSSCSSASELDAFKLILDADLVSDLVCLTQKTPAELIMEQEETDHQLKEKGDIRKEVVAGILSFLFKPVRSMIPSVFEVSVRTWVLTYLCTPSLINSLSLSDIGKLLGQAFDTPDLSRQTLSARTKKMSSSLNIKARSMKSETSNEKYSVLAKERWADRKEEQRKEKRREYEKNWRAKNIERKREQDKAYYRANRKRILEARKKQRERNKITL